MGRTEVELHISDFRPDTAGQRQLGSRLARQLDAGRRPHAVEDVGSDLERRADDGLTITDQPTDWIDDTDLPPLAMGAGLASISVVREHNDTEVSVCGYLVDTYCQGVKNAVPPMSSRSPDPRPHAPPVTTRNAPPPLCKAGACVSAVRDSGLRVTENIRPRWRAAERHDA